MTKDTERNQGIASEMGKKDEPQHRFTVKKLVEGLSVNELAKHGASLRKDVYEKLGLVDREAYESMVQRVDAVEAKLGTPTSAGKPTPTDKVSKD